MKKASLLAGAVGGVIAAVIASDKSLRRKLGQVQDPTEAAKVLGDALAKKGKVAARDAKAWLESPGVQSAIDEGKDILHDAMRRVERSAKEAAASLKKQAGSVMKKKGGKGGAKKKR